MFQFLNNIPNVTKNLLIINVLMYFASHLLFKSEVVNLFDLLAAHHIGTPMFEPYQVITHLFMHSQFDFMHLFMNMFALVIFGSFLEKVWGAKRFFIFYFLAGIGAYLIENTYYGFEIIQLKTQIANLGVDITSLDNFIKSYSPGSKVLVSTISDLQLESIPVGNYLTYSFTSGSGASGAIFGLLGAFVILFPNTELMLLFIPFPIKAKYLIGFYILYEIYSFLSPKMFDNIDHLAHISGAIIGITYVLINRRIDKKNFY